MRQEDSVGEGGELPLCLNGGGTINLPLGLRVREASCFMLGVNKA